MIDHVNSLKSQTNEKLLKTIGFSAVELDTNSNLIRSKETAIGNFITDIIRYEQRTQICVLNSGEILKFFSIQIKYF